MRRLLPLLLVPLAACGVSEDDFQEEFSTAVCQTYVSCLDDAASDSGFSFSFFETEEECVQLYDLAFALGTSDCDYDKKAAKECLSEIEGATCDQLYSDDFGTACAEVYTGDACGWGGSGSDTGW